MTLLSTTHAGAPAYVTAFYAPAESRDPAATVACSNGSTTALTRVHVISVTGDDVRRRLPRIRVNIVSSASSSSAPSNTSAGLLYGLLHIRVSTQSDVK